MTKTIISTIALIVCCMYANAQNIAPSKAVSFLQQPYSSVKTALIQQGYSFVERDENWFIFKKGSYELTAVVDHNTVSTLSVQENVSNYSNIIDALTKSQFSFSSKNEYKQPPSKDRLRPTDMLAFTKSPSYMCTIVIPINYYKSQLITINYGFR